MLKINRYIKICAVTIILSCCDVSSASYAETFPESLGGLTPYSLPVIDGSESTMPLRHILVGKLLKLDYKWERDPFAPPGQGLKMIYLDYSSIPNDKDYLIKNKLITTNTHPSFISLIEGKVDIIITARDISRDEQSYAEKSGVRIMSKPIAMDALTFMVSPKNPVENLTHDEIRGIYSGNIKFWSQVGGSTEPITPYVRNRNSGSQEKFETMVMDGLEIPDFPELQIGTTMESPYIKLKYDKTGISYTPFYYYNFIVDNDDTKAIGINGVSMTKEHIIDGTYPYNTEVFVCVRENIDKSSVAYELYRYLTTYQGQEIVEESGYVPILQSTGIRGVPQARDIKLQGNVLQLPRDMSFSMVLIYDMNGQQIMKLDNPNESIYLGHLPVGLYMVQAFEKHLKGSAHVLKVVMK